jgi:hypothetical protein
MQINYPTPRRRAEKMPEGTEMVPGLWPDDEPVVVWWDPVVTVHWDKGNSEVRDYGGEVALSISEYPQMTGAEYDALTHGPGRTAERAMTRKLTRVDLNRLIAALRKARDEAYGRDE